MKNIQNILKKASKELFDIDIEPTILIPEDEFGDYSTNLAMILAKQLNKNPRELADEILDFIAEQPAINFDCVIAGPGFINFTLHNSVLINYLENSSKNDNLGRNKLYENKNVVTEFSDPNPFKVLHMGHFYTSVVGDAISNLIEIAGGKVHRVNFGGDVGLHVAKTMWAILEKIGGENSERLKEVPEGEEADWLSERYVEGNNAYSDNDSAKLEIIDLNKRIYKITNDNDRESELAKIFWKARQWSYRYFDTFYNKIGVKFEKYYPESETAKFGLDTVQAHPDVYTKSNGATVFEGEKFNLHTRVFINSEGLPTYETKDLGCTMQKYEDYKFDEQIIITGNDIIEYMKVVLKSIELYAPQIALSTKHLTHGMLKLPGGVKQSSRLGNFVKAYDILEMVAKAQKKEQGESNDATILGAIKYAFLKNRLGPDVVFDPETSVSLNGDSGPYLQYASARAKSILRKSNYKESSFLADWQLDKFERALAVKLFRFNEVVEQATIDLAPHQICNYIYELSSVFNRFYENSKVTGSPREQIRISLVSLCVKTLDKSLNILGIPTMEKM
jgi:arginyl-tRNA synthetase